MKEYLFRAWDKKTKKMYHIITDIHSLISGEITRVKWCTSEIDCGWLDDFILMQFTGLKDKNGKDGYHSDICDYEYVIYISPDPECEPRKTKGRGVIVYNDGCFMIKDLKTKQTIPMHYGDLSFEIIGNTLDNPELLNEVN